MALPLPHSVFIHVPKTGGSWVREAIRRAGIDVSGFVFLWHERFLEYEQHALLRYRYQAQPFAPAYV